MFHFINVVPRTFKMMSAAHICGSHISIDQSLSKHISLGCPRAGVRTEGWLLSAQYGEPGVQQEGPNEDSCSAGGGKLGCHTELDTEL